MSGAAGVVVIGGGQAGVEAAAAVREHDPDLPVTIVADEPCPPYQRPPLSKSLWAADLAAEALPLRPSSFYDDREIRLLAGTRAVGIDRHRRSVSLEGGDDLPYVALVLATGSRARRIGTPEPIHGAHVLRTLPDGQTLSAALRAAETVVVVGGGFIGLEVAAAATENGVKTVVLEAQEQVLARALSADCARWLTDFHEGRGTEIRRGTTLSSLRWEGGAVRAVVTDQGHELPADLVLTGVGAEPNVGLAEAAGLEVRDGIVVDSSLRTTDPAIWAVGDCARFPCALTGSWARLESVQNASDQGSCAGGNIVRVLRGQSCSAYTAVPWFWSQQASARLQIAGLGATGTLRFVARRHSENKISFLGFRPDGRLAVVESINAAADHLAARRLLAAGTAIDPDAAGDPRTPLKSLLG